MNEWISVKDRLPEKDGTYLVNEFISCNGVHSLWYDKGSGWDYDSNETVTHWQPLPEPPNEQHKRSK
jgi:hypothetical protein